MRVGCPPTPMVTWAASPHVSLAPGSEQRVTHCCYEHADQTSVHLRTLGQPAATADRKKRGGGFLLKDAEPEVLLTAIRTVHEGEAVISSRMTARLLEYIGQLPDRGPHAHQGAPLTAALTPREHEVLEAMARGASNPEIAAALQLSEATVKSHVGRIFAKTGSRDRVHAVILAFQEGLVAPGEPASQASRRSVAQTPARKTTTAKPTK